LNQDSLLGSITTHAGLNRFAYANGNPVTGIDPFGLDDWEVGAPYQPWSNFSTIVTDGNGGIAIKLSKSHDALPSVARTSVMVHEGSHRVDALNSNPDIAAGKPAGLMIVTPNPATKAVSEIDACNRQIDYLNKQLQSPNLSARERDAAEAMRLQALRYETEEYDELKKITGDVSVKLPDASGNAKSVCGQ
jgi:hypothetical protein